MNRTRPWLDLLLGLLLGLSLGLAIAWWIAPNTRVDLSPAALHSEYKDEFRLLVASAYLATGDTGRAQVRLSLLGDMDIISALIDEALRIQAGQTHSLQFSEDPEQAVNALALLANALQDFDGMPPVVPTGTTVTPGRSPTPTLSAFVLISTETTCDPDQTVSLAKVNLRDRAGNPLPGVEVLVTWEGGRQSIFTGLKPDIDPGYADFLLTPGTEYALQVLPSSLPVPGLSAPVCTGEDGSSYTGGLRLVFQQP